MFLTDIKFWSVHGVLECTFPIFEPLSLKTQFNGSLPVGDSKVKAMEQMQLA